MPRAEHILVIDDDPGVVALWEEVLERAGFRAQGCTAPRDGLQIAIDGRFDLVLCDVEMPGLRGPELLERLVEARPDQLVVLITAFGSIETAVEALRHGAVDFVSKPCSPDTLLHVVRRSLDERTLRREVVRLRQQVVTEQQARSDGLIANSPAMKRVLDLARRVARAEGPALLQGESGTGKTALARFIHDHSPRAAGPFVAVNSSALPTQLAEAELFGVRKGAFTDATEDRPGLLRSAQGGTVFLDEIVDLPAAVQTKLLTALETRTVRPVGDTRDVPVDVRLIAASNTPLADAVAEGRFRADLRYRLDVLTLSLPPLRERLEDLGPLVDLWLGRLAERHGREVLGVSAAGWRWLQRWPWPGNVRELINRLERAVVFADAAFLGPDDLQDPGAPPEVDAPTLRDALRGAAEAGLSMAALEELYLEVALEATEQNKSAAAKLLGIDRRTLYRRLDDG